MKQIKKSLKIKEKDFAEENKNLNKNIANLKKVAENCGLLIKQK